MLTGVLLHHGTPVIELQGRGSREELTVEGILDTGFDGFRCWPISGAVPLGLALVDTITSDLADGTLVEEEVVVAGQAEGDGAVRHSRLLLTRSADVLLGTAFLAGDHVLLDYPASAVRVERVPYQRCPYSVRTTFPACSTMRLLQSLFPSLPPVLTTTPWTGWHKTPLAMQHVPLPRMAHVVLEPSCVHRMGVSGEDERKSTRSEPAP